jgi:hypothetical protein
MLVAVIASLNVMVGFTLREMLVALLAGEWDEIVGARVSTVEKVQVVNVITLPAKSFAPLTVTV